MCSPARGASSSFPLLRRSCVRIVPASSGSLSSVSWYYVGLWSRRTSESWIGCIRILFGVLKLLYQKKENYSTSVLFLRDLCTSNCLPSRSFIPYSASSYVISLASFNLPSINLDTHHYWTSHPLSSTLTYPSSLRSSSWNSAGSSAPELSFRIAIAKRLFIFSRT